jgi:NADH-quinone oxidoreductase subunit L
MTIETAAAQAVQHAAGAASTVWWPLWLVALLPAFGALINGVNGLLFRRRHNDGFKNTGFVNMIALGSVGLAFLITLVGFIKLMGMAPDSRSLHFDLWTWFDLGGARVNGGPGHAVGLAQNIMKWSYKLDPLSACMGLLVTGAGFLIHLFSTGYMAEEQKDGRYWRFMTYMNLFVFSMLNLVLGANLMMMFLGWEGVGLCSYLLIGYYFDKDFAATAGKKAFVTNRIGDFGFVIGFSLLFMLFGSVDFDTMMGMTRGVSGAMVNGQWVASQITILGCTASSTFWFNLTGCCLFLGAAGKSAQIPLYVWLPDAMAGPTPVSALIHAATMVTSGLYMICRLNFIYVQAPVASDLVLFVGALTALFAASMGTAQYDIKKVLAYSTVSQLGFMFMGMGAQSYTAGMFHVFTHAFFKAALFLGSGSVIAACHHEQDMRNMGGLRKYMPITFTSMGLATRAINGIFPFSGFFSKDEILWKVFERWHNGEGTFYLVCWLMGLFGAFFTAFYMTRLMAMTFFGDYRGAGDDPHHLTVPSEAHHGDDHGHDDHGHGEPAHAHAATDHTHDDHGHGGHGPAEVSWNMWLPVAILAGLAVIGGFLNVPQSLKAYIPLPNEGFSRWIEPLLYQVKAPHHGEHHAPAIEYWLMLFANVWAGLAMFWAWRWYKVDPSWSAAKAFVKRYPELYEWVNAKYYVDEFYEALLIGPCKRLSAQLWSFDTWVVDGMVNGAARFTLLWAEASYWFDANIVDGAVNLVAWLIQQASLGFKALQSGRVQNYAFVMFLGFIVFAVWKFLA